MMSRYEYIFLREKLKRLKEITFHFENGEVWDEEKNEYKPNTLYKTWNAYSNMSHLEKEKLHEAWDEYYRQSKETPIGKLFWQEMRPAFIAGDMPLVKELAKKAKTLPKAQLKQPSSIDPTELESKMSGYFMILGKIKSIKQALSEYKGVYEKAEESLL